MLQKALCGLFLRFVYQLAGYVLGRQLQTYNSGTGKLPFFLRIVCVVAELAAQAAAKYFAVYCHNC
jgi:hypothetical protein